ncbi:hypothetical protein COU20_00515 [Candidatus Kaiserbacteria bacterium CG10_big_fil_rev_8_21_14_0_10_59_10]|uniref:Adenylate kinase n=1 Tax=Candidatus Kaiserbacteria bacterium CG10_big_fil_rev_8_21_14_0_10_59_10 TaxID=1974612 RepID=A0A2H0U8R9_9BACT|nr:MAG: hypothetical protein COU20_00515 [Candidatus Kaiserbacteria bacterium CG10_big_fil_rev_8_21_14_0_10_59_10]
MSLDKPLTVAFFGISGSGKGTQSALLEDYLKEQDPERGIVRPEMGSLLRAYVHTGSPLAKHIEGILAAGGLVPSFMPIHLLTKVMDESFDGTQHVILDGTCRRPDQSRAVDDMMRLWNRPELQAIVLVLSKESARERLQARGRYDDATEEALNSRFAWYEEHVVPSVEKLRELGWTIHEVDGEPTIEEIHQNILRTLSLA